MKLARIGAAALIAILASSPALAQDEPAPSRAVVLPVELKDPATAFTLGTIPFYSGAAAAYVGSSRFHWTPNQELSDAAGWQVAADAGILATYLALTLVAGTPTSNPSYWGMQGAALLTLIALPVTHLAVYAPYWGDRAVEFNKDQVVKAGFPVQE